MSASLKSIPAIVSPNGTVTLSEPVKLIGPAVAMVTILFEDEDGAIEPALLSEDAFRDWNRPEEDKAWEYLQESPPFNRASEFDA
ncbi:MAG: hypothetical protein H7A53_01165 [Akkermansiaceae bacterium]|nr:hypothetical protein [Akkermansiaceae bacterium]MCP5549495.1 hypothetical protein [Akkermansiaceae bacterium]